MKVYAQGDVLITPVDKMPKRGRQTVEEIKDGIVARGESTGHAHRLMGKFALMRFSGDPSALFLDVPSGGPVVLKHEEHAPIELPPGVYKITTQREYTPQAVRNVSD